MAVVSVMVMEKRAGVSGRVFSIPPVSWQGHGVSTGPKAEGTPAFASAGLKERDV